MSNVQELRTQAHRHNEASLWIAKLDEGLSSEETDALKRWLNADADNSAVLLRMASVWDRADTLSRLADVVPHSAPKAITLAPPAWLAAAAALVVVVLGGVWGVGVWEWPGDRNGRVEVRLASEQSVYETAIGAQSKVKLSDGTAITLNTNSRIRVRYSVDRRLVFLERGEIHIDVAHDESRPLGVVAGDRIIQAVGTAFSVRIDRGDQIDLVVTDGRVQVSVRSPAVDAVDAFEGDADTRVVLPVLIPGSLSVAQGEEVLLGSPDEAVKTLAPDDIEVRLSWRDGNLIFRGEVLGDAVAEISRYTPVEFVFMTEDLEHMRVAGLFRAGDVAGFLVALQANFGIASERVGDDKILLKPATAHVP